MEPPLSLCQRYVLMGHKLGLASLIPRLHSIAIFIPGHAAPLLCVQDQVESLMQEAADETG